MTAREDKAVMSTEDVGMTTTVMSTEDVGMTTTAMSITGGIIGLIMATGKDIIPRRRSSMHRLHSRASVSFSRFIAREIASRRLPRVKSGLIWVAVASNPFCCV